MSFTLVNFFNTTLSAASSSTATTFTVSSSTNLPTLASGEVLPITLNDAATRLVFEICYVTGISGNILTVERAQEGTSAQNWNVGDFIWNGPTAGTALLTNMPNPFIIPNATANDNPVALGQLLNTYPIVADAAIGSGTTVSVTSASFPAPSDGFAVITGYVGNNSATQALTCSLSSSLSGLVILDENISGDPTSTLLAYLPMTAGQSSTFSGTVTVSTAGTLWIKLYISFVPNP